jgi:DNA-directed RNA polymerase specialized sigma24 family protein
MDPQDRDQDPYDGYELFRRAIVERDEHAWAEGTARYRQMLIGWVMRCSASATTGEHCDDLADSAIARAWASLVPERFAQFPNLAALLAYLRACVTSAVNDSARAELRFGRAAEAFQISESLTPEQLVLDRLDNAELWRVANRATQTEQERVVLVESYIYDLPPRSILNRHPDLFANAAAISIIKRNLLSRLKTNLRIRQLYREWMSV